MKNNTYAVTLEITAGEHEKHNRMLIHAPNWEKAWHYACYSESHNPTELDWEAGRGCAEPCWSFFYRCDGVDEVPADEVPVLRKHLSYMIYNADDLAKSGNYLEEMV